MYGKGMLLLFVMLLLAGISAPPAAAIEYTIVDLGALAGWADSRGYAINNLGHTAGTSGAGFPAVDRAFYRDSSMQNLGVLPGATASFGRGVNSSGRVAGFSGDADVYGYQRAFIWSSTSGMQPLGTLGGDISRAYAINDSNKVVGYSENSSLYGRGFIWDSTSGMQDLGTLGGQYSFAFGINNLGKVVGSAETFDYSEHAFIWYNGGMQNIGALSYADGSAAYDINDTDQVVGDLYDYFTGTTRAFMWDNTDGFQYIYPLAGFYSTFARGINNLGQAAGYVDIDGLASTPFVWDAVNGMQELPLLGGSSGRAYGINDSGWIVGYSDTADFHVHAVIWKPVPEPSSLLALGAGFLGLVGFVRRRR